MRAMLYGRKSKKNSETELTQLMSKQNMGLRMRTGSQQIIESNCFQQSLVLLRSKKLANFYLPIVPTPGPNRTSNIRIFC
jgi:hypothetical protein